MMRIGARIAIGTAAFGMAAGTLTGVSSAQDTQPAAKTAVQKAEQAKAKKCKKHYVCLWDKKNYKGRMLQFNDEQWHNLANWGFSNRASSAKNRTSQDAVICDGRNGKGRCKTLKANTSYPDLGWFNNKASSLYA